MTSTARIDPDDFSTYAEDIGALRFCAACGGFDDVLDAWVAGAGDQLMCRECADAWVRLVWPDVYLRRIA